jgi:hypothetical protein
VSRQEVLHLVALDERDVFLMYETTSRPVGPTATAR